MTLQELIAGGAHLPEQSVPEWMLGCFRRRSISFANGESDDQTIVYWFQSRNFTIDLRLPRAAEQVRARNLADYNAAELRTLADYEGWEARCHWNGETLQWFDGTALQFTDRWPEVAELRRIGNCMIEFAPSGAYMEDWRLQPSSPGPLVGLRLVEEYFPETGQRASRRGGLIICGDHAALVLGRKDKVANDEIPLPDQVSAAVRDIEQLQQLLDFETSVGSGSLTRGFTVAESTRATRVGQPLFATDGFHWSDAPNQIQQTLMCDGTPCIRRFDVDVLQASHNYALQTPATKASEAWFQREATTLRRYTGVLA